MAVHIGAILRDYCLKNSIKPAELAAALKISVVSVHNMFDADYMRSDKMMKLSVALKHDFFQYFQTGLEVGMAKDLELVKNELSVLKSESVELKAEMERLKMENEVLKGVLKLTMPEK